MPSNHQSSAAAGQASVELIAVVPLLIAAALILAQLVGSGWALWSAATGARAGARAAAVDGRTGRAARSALPGTLGRGVKVRQGDLDDERVRVSVQIPVALPGLDPGRAVAESRLTPDDG